MFAQVLMSIFKKSKQPKPSSPIPSSVTKIRKYASHNRRVLRWEDGTFYDGECSNGTILEGMGKLCMSNGQFYEGNFFESQFHGSGKFTYTDGSYYEGQWKNDIRNGMGKQVNIDGTEYVGTFKNGVKNGFGVLTWSDGSYYEGNFVNDVMEGLGKFKYPDGSMYVGEWLGGKQHGEGQLHTNSSLFKGQFKNGIRHGQGTEICKQTGKRIEGHWENGKVMGRILIFESDHVRSAKMIEDEPNYLTDAEFQSQISNEMSLKYQ